MNNHPSLQRRFIRFPADALSVAHLDWIESGSFRPTEMALVFSESQGGCGLVLLHQDVNLRQKIRVKVGDLQEILGEVVWKHQLDNDVLKIGVRYLDHDSSTTTETP